MKELVTVLSLIGVGLWVVHEGTPWLYRMAVMSGDPHEFPPDPRFVGFNTDGPNTRQEMRRYRAIYINSKFTIHPVVQRGWCQKVPLNTPPPVVSLPPFLVNLADFKSQGAESLAR